MMNRRTFLTSSALLSLAHLGPTKMALAAAPSWKSAFDAALAEKPFLLGFKGTDRETLTTPEMKVDGTIPSALKGRFYRNGPAAHERFGRRYHHWFDADGMIQEFRFADGKASHRGRMIATPKRNAETTQGRLTRSGFGTKITGSALRSPDDTNVANISVLDQGGELLALWEGGSATVIDRESLTARGFKIWGKGLKGLPFSAHPKVDPDGTLWSFGYSVAPKPVLVVWHISKSGALKNFGAIPVSSLGMLHDFVVTQRHLIFVLPPFVFTPEHFEQSTFLDAHKWQAGLGTRVLVIDKSDFTKRRWYQLPAGFGFHHGNAWEEKDGSIHFDHCVAPDATLVTETLRYVMRGEVRSSTAANYTNFVLRPDGTAKQMSVSGVAEFPKVAPSHVGKQNRFVYHLSQGKDPAATLFNSVVRRDLKTGKKTSFDYASHQIAEEHIFVPRPNTKSEDDGWVVGTFLDWKKKVSGVSVFEAAKLGDGPVAQAWLNYPIPLGFHGTFSAVS